MLVGMEIGAATVEKWKFLKKLKPELPYDPAIPLLGIEPKKQNAHLKRYMHPNVQSSIIYNCQGISSVQWLSCVRLFTTPWIAARQASLSITNSIWREPKCSSTDEWIEMWCVCVCIYIYIYIYMYVYTQWNTT